MDEQIICLNARKFEFLLLALQELTKPILDKEKFRVIVEKDPDFPRALLQIWGLQSPIIESIFPDRTTGREKWENKEGEENI